MFNLIHADTSWYIWFALIGLTVCLLSCSTHLVRLVRLGKPKDFSKKVGNTQKAIMYSFTGAMNPAKKESAFMHLPTYTAGILYHLGTFLSIAVFFLMIFNIYFEGLLYWIIPAFLFITGLNGLGILIKRMIKKELLALSNPDDFISNILVTLFQFITALTILNIQLSPVYFVLTGILLLYFPVGKLKHTVYFFAARYHLGFFYGWRNAWPPKKI